MQNREWNMMTIMEYDDDHDDDNDDTEDVDREGDEDKKQGV